MKIGSIVICVDDTGGYIANKLVKGKLYTVRNIKQTVSYSKYEGLRYVNSTSIYLDEIVNEYIPELKTEIGYSRFRFRDCEVPVKINIEEIELDNCKVL